MRRQSLRLALAYAVLCLSFGCAGRPEPAAPLAPAVPAGPRELRVASYALNAFKPELDGQWLCMCFASDGKVYFASSTHASSHGAAFFKYNPDTKEVTLLCKDITEVCGEDPKVNPQGKLHSPLVEANGWLYTATHFSSERPGAEDTYTGAHALGYELATGKFRDFGVVHPGYTVYAAVEVDPLRNLLYVHATPNSWKQVQQGGAARLYRVDIASGKKEELAKFQPGRLLHNFWFFLDRRGDCWFTRAGASGALFRVRAATGKVERYDDALPKRYLTASEQVAPEDEQGRRMWCWAQALPGGDRCLFTQDRDGMLWAFDAAKFASGADAGADDVAKAIAPVKHIGPTGLGMCLAGNRVYYVQRANRTMGDNASISAPDLHLLSVELGADASLPAEGVARPITDHGLIVDQDGRHPWRIESMAADGKGKVFMTGDWIMNAGETGRMYTPGDRPRAYRDTTPRGQFFAVADVAGDLHGANAGK